jgi:CHAT domain-containing protein
MRNLEDHIGPEELACLPESLEDAWHDQAHEELFLHIDQCQSCAQLIAVHFRLHEFGGHPAPVDASSCPSQTEWLEYAAGLHPDRASYLLAHAAQCSSCAARLRESKDWIQPGMTEQKVEGLKSSGSAWQQRIAARMAKEVRATEGRRAVSSLLPRWKFRSPWLMVPVTTVLLVGVILGGVRIWRAIFPSNSRLLALAYNQQRRIPLRIAGGDPVPMASETRAAGDTRSSPAALLKLKLRAQQHLEQEPTNAYWHQVLGEVNLLEDDGFEARRNLEIAQTGNPSLPNLQSDLAAAWFLVGDAKGSTEAYAEAAELYSKALLDPHADVGLLFFNRALCWERQNAMQNSLADLRSALAAEKSPAWRRAIEAEIARLTGQSSNSPGRGSLLNASLAGAPAGLMGDEYEQDLEYATERLLSRWASDRDARAEIVETAKLGLRHRDRWLADWVAASHGHSSPEGDRILASALFSVASGDLERSLAQSEGAIRFYTQAGNYPGQVRALLARAYALQRLDRSRECLSAAAAMEQIPGIGNYAWIRAQLYDQEGSCRLALGDFDGAGAQFSQAARSSAAAGLFSIYLRTLGAQSQILLFRGSPIEAWQMDTGALSLCQQAKCPPIREYLLTYTMVQGAQLLDLPHVAVELMRTGEKLAAASGDATTQAYATESLALVAGRAGDFEQSDRSFKSALAAAERVRSIRSVDLYRAEWQTDRADVLLRRGEPAEAIELLTKDQNALLASDYQHGRILYFTRLSAAQLATGQLDRALRNALASVTEAEKTLPTLHTTIEREQWQRENSQCYMQLIAVYLRQHQMDNAFLAWERSRYLPLAANSPAIGSTVPALSEERTIEAGSRIVTIALIGDTYVGWLVGINPLRVLRTAELGDRATIHRLVTTFYHLCSDPDSKVRDIRTTGAQVYSVLLQPFADAIGATQPIWLDLDSSLISVAFPALTVPGGGWLGKSHQISVLPFWWVNRPWNVSDAEQVVVGSRVVIVNGFARHQSAYSEVEDLAGMFSHSVVLDEQNATPSATLHALESAEIFHFSGHATSESGSTRLLFPAQGNEQPYLGAESLFPLRLLRCRIAVLAACNTNASNPDRVEFSPDLRNALLQSGVHAVIASHWDVDDHATAALMNLFYRHLLDGDSASYSLRLAEQAIASDPKWQHPYYWASFQLFAN